jgi:methyl-accepting chemotaxis protein
MEKINESSDEIKKVVKVIDDIAFQINLLALNANVEAARAGKYGKGFAVVADEVRNLAVRSAAAVKGTTEMVDETVRNIGIGNELAAATAQQLEEMSIASKEQAEGVEQINSGLGQIDQVTQGNTASAEETASAAEELASQAQELRSILSRFKLSSSSPTSPTSGGGSGADRSRRSGRGHVPQGVELNLPRVPRNGDLVHAGNNGNGTGSITPNNVIKLDDDDFGEF